MSLLTGVGLWLVPPIVLVGAPLFAGEAALSWAAAVCLLSALTFGSFTRRLGASPWYGALYPLGAAVGAFIFARSWVRGRR